MGSLTTADSALIGTFESSGVYAAGHVFFMRGGNLMAQSFNEETLQLEGDPVPLGVQVDPDMPWAPDSRSPRTADLCSSRRPQRSGS